NDVAGPGDDHLVTLTNVLAREVLLVVEGRGRHRDAADPDRLEHREWEQAAGPADVPDDPVELGRRRDRRELPRHRPPGLTPGNPELPPQGALIDLDDDAVDLEI